MSSSVHNGWVVWFSKNVHMYTHSLIAQKCGYRVDIPCEDVPDGGGAIWIYDLELNESLRQSLLSALQAWSKGTGRKWRIYVSRTDFETIGH